MSNKSSSSGCNDNKSNMNCPKDHDTLPRDFCVDFSAKKQSDGMPVGEHVYAGNKANVVIELWQAGVFKYCSIQTPCLPPDCVRFVNSVVGGVIDLGVYDLKAIVTPVNGQAAEIHRADGIQIAEDGIMCCNVASDKI